MDREFEVVLFGATGFTGRLTAIHLIQNYLQVAEQPLRLALAGRDGAKLSALRTDLAQRWPAAATIPLIQADAFDPKALAAVASRAKVIITTVGPYAKYGMPLVEACARAGTDYVDLTGEVTFMRRTIDAYDAIARASRARIVHTCGYDSIPSDLGSWLAMRTYVQRYGALPQRVLHAAGEARGGVSGGTTASMIELFEELSKTPSLRRLFSNPYALVDGERGDDRRVQLGVRYDRALRLWTAPFVMAPVNSQVVHRSLMLQELAQPRGWHQVSYDECMSTGRGVKGLLLATVLTGLLGTGSLLMTYQPSRRFAQKWLLPKPGTGPSPAVQAAGYFVSRLIATGPAGEVRVTIRGEGDPGYAATSRMLAESAICLARDAVESPGGIRTPASTMAEPLLARLGRQKIRFETD